MGWWRQKFLWFHRKSEISIFDENHEFDNIKSISAADGRNFDDFWRISSKIRNLNFWWSIMAPGRRNFCDFVENWKSHLPMRIRNFDDQVPSNSRFSSEIDISHLPWCCRVPNSHENLRFSVFNEITEIFHRNRIFTANGGCANKIMRILKNPKSGFRKIIHSPRQNSKKP